MARRRPAPPERTGPPPVDLGAPVAASDATRDVQCPACGDVATAADGHDRGPEGYVCATCGRRWKVGAGAPWPDVVVDAAATRPMAPDPR